MTTLDVAGLNRIWNEEDASLAGELFAEDAVVHDIPMGTTYEGVDAFVEWMRGTREAFPDMHVETLDTVVTTDRLVARWVVEGTHEGELAFGAGPTNRTARWEGATVYELRDGVVSEAWWYYDMLGILRQLGLVPDELPA